MNARAAVWTNENKMEIRSFEIPKAGENDLVLKVICAGVCGTDGHLFPQEPPYPAVLGHEIVGEIVDIGKNANRSLHVYGGELEIGDRIVLYPWITCGKCKGCLTHGVGTCTVCDRSFVYGIPYEKLGLGDKARITSDATAYPYFKGGFAEYMYVYEDTFVWKIPKEMPSEIAVLLDPLAVAVRAVEMAITSPGVLEEAFTTNANVLVIGDGPVGAFCSMVSRMMGVSKVFMIGGRDERMKIANSLSKIDKCINYKEYSREQRVQIIKDLTDQDGACVVFQCSNSPDAFLDGLHMMRRLGTLIEVGNMVNSGQTVALDPASDICSKHARIIGMSANTPSAFNKAFNILKRYEEYDFESLFTHITDLDGVKDTISKMKDDNYFKGLMKIE